MLRPLADHFSMTPQHPRNATEFDALMWEIDHELQRRGIPVHDRVNHAAWEVSNRYQFWTLARLSECRLEPGKYTGESLLAHVGKWYEETYGSRLMIHLGPGTIAVMIRGTPWRVRYPRFFGEFSFRLTPLHIPESELPSHPLVDPLDSIEDLPTGLRTALGCEEYRALASSFIRGLEALHALERLRARPYIHEATGDQQMSVDHLLADRPQYGHSRWNSLQFVEKLLKCYLVASGSDSVPRDHRLHALLSCAITQGLVFADAGLIDAVVCSAGVRYGQAPSTLEEAYAAHEASTEICRLVAPQIDGLPGGHVG